MGPCNIAAAVDADDLLTSLICIGVNGVNELPTEHRKQKWNKKWCKQKTNKKRGNVFKNKLILCTIIV